MTLFVSEKTALVLVVLQNDVLHAEGADGNEQADGHHDAAAAGLEEVAEQAHHLRSAKQLQARCVHARAADQTANDARQRPGRALAAQQFRDDRTNHRAANAKVQGGHTRLPAYSAGCEGRIIAQHGCHVFPDSNAHGFGEDPKPLYSVAFKAVDLWGQAEHPNDEVVLDLWEPYLSDADG